MIVQFLGDLLQSVASLVVVACCRALFVVHSDYTLSISLDARIFSLCGIQLGLIVTRIHRSQQLTLPYVVASLHIHLQDRAAHTERHIDVVSRLREIHAVHTVRVLNDFRLHVRYRFRFLLTIVATSTYYQRSNYSQ